MASKEFPVAIIGMAVRLPGAESCNEFWKLLIDSQDTVSKFPENRASDVYHTLSAFHSSLLNKQSPFFTGSYFKSVDKFDAGLFSINPKEALFIEPEQRFFLELVWELLEDAGYASKIKGTKTGVYVGNTVNKYKYILTENHPSVSHGNHSPFISSRVSYTLNLSGPAMMVASGCSSSLLAVHLACQGLLSKDCDMAIAGGITLDLLPLSLKTDIWNQLGITGPNVKCRAFDANAKGIAKGEGCGAILLKPLNKAVLDGDFIYAVLEASTANQDGHSNGITAPHPIAQANLLCQAWNLAKISPNLIGYFEAHGTGTELGDPIEVSGITTAFKNLGLKSCEKIPMSSVKANIGHLADGGAGIVALIKVVLCLIKGKIPPSVNYSKPNPHINWEAAPVYVNTALLDWKPNGSKLRYASISAFGLLGTNVHTVVREFIHVPFPKTCLSTTIEKEMQILAMAANSQHSLYKFICKLEHYLKTSIDKSIYYLRNICYTINTSREQNRFIYKAIVYAPDFDKMIYLMEKLVETHFDLEDLTVKVVNISHSDSGFIAFYKGSSINIESNHDVIESFLKGKSVNWLQFYQNHLELKRVPLVPTYAFDRKRFWPETNKPINVELLQLEHQIGSSELSDHEKGNNQGVSELRLAETLNDALGVNYNWQERGNDDLFALGMDSLIFARVCMMLQNENLVHGNLFISKFHQNPTFNGLKTLLEDRYSNAKSKSQVLKTIDSTEVNFVVNNALNEALGVDYDWEMLKHKNLFELGMDSLICTHVSMKLQNELKISMPIPLAELHNHPTFDGLCELIRTKVKIDSKMLLHQKDARIEQKDSLYPLSFTQKRLWVTQEMVTNCCAYNCTNCLKITGKFHPAAFVQAVNTVLSRHSSFYTIFVEDEEGPMQTYDWDIKHQVEEINLVSYGNEADSIAMKLYNEDYKTPIILKQSPLYRCKLLQLPNDIYYFAMVIHHIIFDGWSHFVFHNELWGTYIKLCEGNPISTEMHEPFFAQFARMEESLSDKVNNDLEYWKKKLLKPIPITTLPGDKRRPPIFTYQGRRFTHFIAHSLIDSLQKISKNHYTVFTNLLSLVYVLLYHYTGDKDLIIGSPVAGRTDDKAKHVIGCFVNMLVLRVQIEENFTFGDVLEIVSKSCVEAFDRQSTPFDHLVNLLDLCRGTSTTPLFSVSVCYHNTEIQREHINPPTDLHVERNLVHNNSAKWDLYFDFLQEDEGLRFTLEYYSDVFTDAYAKGIVDYFVALLESVTRCPSMSISECRFPVNQMLQNCSYNVIHGNVRKLDSSLPMLLLNSLNSFSKASSIVNINGEEVKYERILSRAETFSVFLGKHCKLPQQSRVGLLLSNSFEMLASIVACLFSNFVYVPLDYNSPKSRLEYICNDAKLEAICFSQPYVALANHLQWTCTTLNVLFCVDSDDFLGLQENIHDATLMDSELWNCVASNASDDIQGGGWKSSYTGEHMTQEEMNEYADNILIKLRKHLHAHSKVMEIGCASGITTQKLCPFVGEYVATDLSEFMVKNLQSKFLNQDRYSHVKVICARADQIGETLCDQIFDVIIMNSVVHCFPGHNYLHKVILMCEKLLSEEGVLFLGDIMDLDLKGRLTASLKAFKKAHPKQRVKTEWNNELFLSKDYIYHICKTLPTFQTVSCSRKICTISNELTEFRFDALFKKSKDKSRMKYAERRQCKTYALNNVSKELQDSNYNYKELILEWINNTDLKDSAYILYTSGTTGLPKGVMINHEALLNYLTWSCEAYKFSKETAIPLFSPLTFDFTITCIFPPLLKGSTIHIFKPFSESYKSISSCKSLTTAKFSPLQLDTVLSETTESLTIATYILGGEELTTSLLTKLKKNKADDNFLVWNEYGPTEATVGCIVKCFKGDQLPLNSCCLVPIGKPIDNVTITIAHIENRLLPVPIGGKGKLCIGGKGLCSDFVQSATSKESSRTRNIVSACWGRSGEEMLITDDIVEFMPFHGEIAYLGREKDSNTTKINEIRIDIMEIQDIIANHPMIQNAWVCSFDFKDHTYLGAAVKHTFSCDMKSDAYINIKELLLPYLAQNLPRQFIPAVFITISESPTNANGKKDVTLLQTLFANEIHVSNSDKRNVVSPIVTKLQKIWQSVLPINHLPQPEEDFFCDLSGDSLQAIHLVRKMRQEGFDISITEIFQNPTIAKILPLMQENQNNQDIRHLNSSLMDQFIKFKPTPIIQEFLLTSLKPDHFALSALLEFQNNEINADSLNTALRFVMKKHGSLRSKFIIDEDGVFGQVQELGLDESDVLETNITKTSNSVVNEPEFYHLCTQLELSHSLANGILLKAGIIRYQEETKIQTYALLIIHHVAIDIVSWQQVLEDLALALKRISSGDNPNQPILSTCFLPFSKYCEALHKEANTGIFLSEMDYWKDVERECNDSGLIVNTCNLQGSFKSAVWLCKSIDADYLRSSSCKIGCSDESVLLTLFGKSLSSIHGKAKTAICLESHGRHLKSLDSTDTVGWCTAKFPFVLNAPHEGDFVSQVQSTSEAISKVPNHGLGFGLLKCNKKLNLQYPRIMFVFQGSLDASVKETFDGGKYEFNHIPWIEVMESELQQRKFHRHHGEKLEFDLELIAWIHGGKLKFGCLFDEDTLKKDIVDNLMQELEVNFKNLVKIAKKIKHINLDVISNFNVTLNCLHLMKEALSFSYIFVDKINLWPTEQPLQSLLKVKVENVDMVVILSKIAADENSIQFFEKSKILKGLSKPGKVVVIASTETENNNEYFLEKGDNDVIYLPHYINLFLDQSSNLQYNMPFTYNGYMHIGLMVARVIRGTLLQCKYKVIIVDADYTLWEGECAEGIVHFNTANVALHKFLLKLKHQGMLLVIISKNSFEDVVRIFQTQTKEMILTQDDFVHIIANWEQKSFNVSIVAKALNLGLDTFIFIDDNPLECEQMIKIHPQVLTLQFSSNTTITLPFLGNLRFLDNFNVTAESAQRTKMYVSESIRQAELKNIDGSDDIMSLLSTWNMKMVICKTDVFSIQKCSNLYARAAELLHRTNQFKLNNVNTTLEEDDECWLISLDDCYGSYGIISVITFSGKTVCKQWAISCRALGQEVERRIFHEILREYSGIQLVVNETGHNIPVLKFLKSLSIQTESLNKRICHVSIEQTNINCNEGLHHVEVVTDVHNYQQTFVVNVISEVNRNPSMQYLDQSKLTVFSLQHVYHWIQNEWSSAQNQQSLYHNMFPVIPNYEPLAKSNVETFSNNSDREQCLKTSWMEILQTTTEPVDTDNFLLAGGTSFSAVFLISKLRRVCKLDIDVMDLLNCSNYDSFRAIVLNANTTQNTVCQPTSYNNLSTAQHRMLIMQETAPDSTAYVETIAYYTTNKINTADVFKKLLEHHPILASKIDQDSKGMNLTIFIKQESICCDVELELIKSYEDASMYVTNSIPVMKVISSPLAIFRVLTVEDKVIFVVHIHHIIADDITLSNIAHDLYNIINDTAKEPCPFSSRAVVENESLYLKSSQMDLDEDFWSQVFLTLPPEVNLSILPKGECIWKDTLVYKAKHISKSIPANIVKNILRLCNSLKITEFHFYMACIALVIQRYLGVHEVTLAIPVTTRTDLYQTSDGLFINTVLFRLPIDIDSSVTEYIQDVAKSWLKVSVHSGYPFNEVVNTIWKKHGMSVNSFCCVMFNHVIQSRPSRNELHVISKHAKMPLSIDVVHNNGSNTVKLMCEWASEMIDDGIIERLADGIFEIFQKVINKANNKINDIQVLSFSECSLLKSFSQPNQDYQVLNINKTFKKHVKTHPNYVAIVYKSKTLTYFQLEAMALLIASKLYQYVDQTTLKTKPVILISEKSEYAIASILGIWKAGGHFLPILSNTSNFLNDILECVMPAAIFVSDSVGSDVYMLSKQYEVPFINICTLLNYPVNHHIEFCDPVICESDLSYIIRTSGTTGKPKQCKISHESLGILASAWQIEYRMSTFEVKVLQWAPLSFDVFIGDLIRGLVCSPGTLFICPDELRLDIPYLLQQIKEQNITIAEITPQFAVQLVRNSKHGDLNSLKLLILGSDILQAYIYKKVKQHLKPNQQVVNSYGMTEATVDSTFFEGNIPNTRNKAVPIGKPLPGVTIHILDPKTLHPCPVGTIGELYISGPVLASGDAEIMHIESVNCICLKTNDAAAWLPSGDIEHLGRIDRVTKLRGFRISTTEIEYKILTNVTGVKDACVVVLSSENIDNGNNFLCAFVVQETNHVMDLATLRNQLNGKLPYYMLPDILHSIETIPLSQNGKVNLKALPSLSDVLKVNDRQQNSAVDTNTESQIHATLKELFSEALGTEISHIHLDKTFMEQGGHSLVLLYFATLLKDKTAYDVAIADIFSYPSINSLAAYIQKPNQANTNSGDSIEKQPEFEHNDDIAITGIGLRLPGGIMSLPQLWQALEEGDDIIRDFPEERISDFLKYLPLSSSSICSDTDTYQGAFLESIDQFDCQFFKIAPNEANFMSPEQRLFLQVATEALAEGRDLSEVKGAKIGVFVGQCDIKYAELNHPDEAICIAGMMPGMVATRVAYQWDLKGPSMLVDTACSSSLMALKQACESMRNGECEGALVGGVNLVLYPARKGVFGRASILSSDFHCRPFDKDASGTAVGEGILCIYAQPLQKALKEKKHIYGIVKSIASNNVGHGNGITAPSSVSQESVIKEALNDANVSPSDISFVECHGTGTVLGDRIEISALTSIFNHALPIGSTKSMFGHLDSAAGLLGLFKVLASLMTKQIPPTLHFKTPHPELQNTLISVPSTTVNWKTNNTGKRIAGLSSFGLTGTNCHAIITEPQMNINEINSESSIGLTHYPLLLCGKNLKHVKKQVSLHQIHIQEIILNANKHTLLQLCITVAKRLKELNCTGTGHYECRMIITAENAEQMMKVIKVIMNTENVESFFRLFTLRNDIYFCSPEYKYSDTAYECFLVNGNIDLELLFPGVTDLGVNLASCVTLALYNESRHWLEHAFTQNMIDSDTENLLSLLHKKASETRELIRMLPLGPAQDLKQTQGRFCSAIIIRLLLSTDLAVYLQNDKIVTLEEAFKYTGMLQKYDKLFFIMIRELFENDLIQAVGKNESIKNLDSFNFKCKDVLDVDPESIANNAIDKYPLWADCFRFPLYCSKNLHDVLMGKMSPLSVIYPQDDLNFMYHFDKLGDLLGDVYYNLYMQVIAMYAKNLSRKRNEVRILEVGAGVGYVTRQLLPKLKEVSNIEYWFTDLGKAFVDRAKTIFTDYNFMMKFSTFDITKNPTMQGILGSFDLVISYNVIHTTESIFVSVANLSSCLGEDGVLFIIESVMNETWATLAWGILDGWWYFKDYELRPAEPMLEPKQWEMILGKVGFASVYSFPTNANEKEHVEKFLFICSAKTLQEATNVNQPEWWECITNELQPAIKHDKINNKDQNCDEMVSNEDLLSMNSSAEMAISESMIYKELKDIWCELLGVKDIQPDDDFNFLGGESLLAIQMMHLVSKKIGYQLEIADTFAYPTLQALASFIYEKLSEKHLLTSHSIKSLVSQNEAKFHDDSLVVETKTQGVLLMFPGQGAQKVGMCVSMKDSPPAVEIFTRAKQILGYDILDICTNKEPLLTEKLTSTEFVQVALFTSCIAKVEQLKYEKPKLMKQVTHVAGLSVGEFVALVYAGVLKFEDALRFIQKRGEAMQNDVKKYSTGMISIFGPTLAQLQEFMENHFPAMTISTYLGDNQHTVAGTEEECQAFMQMVTDTNVRSSKMEVIDVRKLKVAGAFHSYHMEQAAILLDPILDNIAFSKPLLPVIMNVNGKIVEDPLQIKLMSRKQLIAAVEWRQSIITAYKCGIRNFIEIAPSRVLSSIVKKRISECTDCNVTYINV